MHLFGLLPDDLASHLGISDSEARRILARAFGHPTSRPVARVLYENVERLCTSTKLDIIERVTDPSDGFVKYLFRLNDGAVAEAVRIPLENGRFTVCLSSQAGCAMGCTFCATGRMGLTRNLEAWEIVAQFIAVRDDRVAPAFQPATRTPAGKRAPLVTGAVFQGQGEPLHNYDAVIRAAQILSHPCGGRIAKEAITISTVGLVPMIERYARERQPYRLIVSLTSAIDERRKTLLPVAGAWPVAEVAKAVREYQRAAGGRVTIAWVMLGGINTGIDEVEALRTLFAGVPLRINLIDVNDARPDGFRPPDARELSDFRDALRTLEVPVVRRYSGGAAKHAACGMLANR